MFLVAVPVWVALAKVYGIYDRDGRHATYSSTDDLAPVFHIVTLMVLLFVLGRHALAFPPADLTRLGLFWLGTVPLLVPARAAARGLAKHSVVYLQNTVIVGAGDVGQAIAHKFLQHPEYGINVVGFVDSMPKERRDDLQHLALIGGPDDLPVLIKLLDVERVVIAFSNERHEDVLALARRLRELNVQIDIVPRLFDMIGPGVEVHSVEGMPLVGLSTLRLARSSRWVKRVVDFVVSAALLALLAPFFLLVAVAIKLDSEGPVFFRQLRTGEGGDPFRMFKFRTMVRDADVRKNEVAHLNRHLAPGGDARMFKILDDPRVTRVGRVLRKYFVDELPQLLNVLAGDMSLIGPRPLIPEEASHVDSWGRRRLDLKPGMTGVWQVLGRSEIPFEEMVKLDYHYVTTWSLAGDLRLLLQTIPLVLRGERAV
jgi:exopolysaccharide biosynthesis polyprenyl glycosylphosphotransferase